jgi:hypothetical protein
MSTSTQALSPIAIAMQNALQKVIETTQPPGEHVAVPSEELVAIPITTSRKSRRKMALTKESTGAGVFPESGHRGDTSKQTSPTLRLSYAGSTFEVPYTKEAEGDRKKIMDFVADHQKTVPATSWVNVLGQIAGATLAIVGSVAMTWALVQGIKATTKS